MHDVLRKRNEDEIAIDFLLKKDFARTKCQRGCSSGCRAMLVYNRIACALFFLCNHDSYALYLTAMHILYPKIQDIKYRRKEEKQNEEGRTSIID